jgi:hypothetical protein
LGGGTVVGPLVDVGAAYEKLLGQHLDHARYHLDTYPGAAP